LHGEGIEILVVAPPGSYLLSSSFADERIELRPEPETEGWVASVVRNGQLLADLNADYYLLGLDALAFEIANSDLPEAVKLRLLPVGNPQALQMVGSKVGLARVMAESGTPGPASLIADSFDELEKAAAQLGFPHVVKGDTGAGGAAVVVVTTPGAAIDESWFPVVVQEYLPGIETGVEALFVHGRLAGWLYSHVVATVSPQGPSSARRFIEPASTDFIAVLNSLGRFGKLHGMFNVSLMWNPETRRHTIFEIDARPNTWFQFGRVLGVDWAALMAGEQTGSSPSAAKHGSVIRLFPHEITAGIRYGKVARLAAWSGFVRGTYDTRNYQDVAVNRFERKLIWLAFKERIARGLILVERALPSSLSRYLRRTGVTPLLGRLMSRPFN
jgi:hypothetical protein